MLLAQDFVRLFNMIPGHLPVVFYKNLPRDIDQRLNETVTEPGCLVAMSGSSPDEAHLVILKNHRGQADNSHYLITPHGGVERLFPVRRAEREPELELEPVPTNIEINPLENNAN